MTIETSCLTELFAALAQGDQRAWGTLCVCIRADLVGVANRLCGDAAQAEDIAQDALLAIRSAAPRVWARSDWGDQDVLRYCKAIAAHKAISARRRVKRVTALNAEVCAMGSTQAKPESSIMQHEMAEMLQDGLQELREPFAEAVTLHHLCGLSQQEVAMQQGVSAATVRTRIWRGLRQLKAALRRRGVQANTIMVLMVMGDLRADTGMQAPALPITSLCSKGAVIMTFSCTVITCLGLGLAMMSQHSLWAESGTRAPMGPDKATGEPASASFQGDVAWTAGGFFKSFKGIPPRLAGDKYLIATGEKTLGCLCRDTGTILWKIDVNADQQRSLIFGDHLIVIGETALKALDLGTGQIHWSHDWAAMPVSVPNNMLVKSPNTNQLIKKKQADGSAHFGWNGPQTGTLSAQTVFRSFIQPVTQGERCIVANNCGFVCAVNAVDGKVEWARVHPERARLVDVLDKGSYSLEMSDTHGKTVYKSKAGASIQFDQLPGSYKGICVSENMIYLSDWRSGLNCFTSAGEFVWSCTISGLAANPPVLHNTSLYVGRQTANDRHRGDLVAVDAASGDILWLIPVGNVIGTPVVFENRVICTTTERVVAVDLNDRSELWSIKRPHHGYERLLLDSAGRIWFGSDARRQATIHCLDSQSGKTIFASNLDSLTNAMRLPRLKITQRKGSSSSWQWREDEPWQAGGKKRTIGGIGMPMTDKDQVFITSSSGAVLALDVPGALPPAPTGHAWTPLGNQ